MGDERLKKIPKSLVLDGSILLTYRGSLAHGTHIPPEENNGFDDVDLLGIYVGKPKDYLGLDDSLPRGKDLKDGEYDLAAYELRKFCYLLSKANPNVLSSLWCPPESILYKSLAAEKLLQSRDLFSSKLAYHSFSGYAYGQLRRMVAYHENGEGSCCSGEIFHEKSCKLAEQRGRGSTKKYATGWMGAKRKMLVEKFGYDVKNASHLLRLLHMGREFLETGELIVDRRGIDAELLVSVKKGEKSLEFVQEKAEAGFALMKEARDKSPLPEKPNREAIDLLLVSILLPFMGG